MPNSIVNFIPRTHTTTQTNHLLRRPLLQYWRGRLGALMGALSTIGALLGLSGCSSVDPAVYANQQPKLSLQQYFNGTVDAWGIFQDRSGEVIKRFTVVINCTWQNEVGTLDEAFTYSDGTTQRRVWTLRKISETEYEGTADDVIGKAQGILSGNSLRWNYTLALPVDGKTYHVQFDDWMFLMDDKIMLNRATMSKFGIRLGEVTLTFRKRT